jgi:hypothetical protein
MRPMPHVLRLGRDARDVAPPFPMALGGMVFAIIPIRIPLLFPAGGEPQRWRCLFAQRTVEGVRLIPSAE